jgi:hypothetical protein
MCSYHDVPKLLPSTLLRKEISSNQWEVQSCSQGALVFFFLSFGFRVGRLKGTFFFSSCLWCRECGRGGFIFLSTNRKA